MAPFNIEARLLKVDNAIPLLGEIRQILKEGLDGGMWTRSLGTVSFTAAQKTIVINMYKTKLAELKTIINSL